MIDIIIIIAVVLLVILTVYIQIRNKKNGKSSCGCGGSSSSSSCGGCSLSSDTYGGDVPTAEPTPKSSEGVLKTLVLDIEGMHCEKCQTSISEALNSLDGVSATVDLAKNCATVVLSKDVPEATLKDAVSDKGFEVTTVRTV